MLYDAIHHARELSAMQQLIYYMWYLLENYATNSEVQAIVNNTELYFIPVLTDGFVYNCTEDPNGVECGETEEITTTEIMLITINYD